MFYSQHSAIRKYTELVCTFLFFLIIDWGTGFHLTNFHPAPLLFVVLLFSLRYGWHIGALSSFLAIAYTIIAAVVRREDIFLMFFDLEQAKWLLFLLFIGMIPGLFITNLREQYETQYYRTQEMAEENRQLRRAVKKLADSRRILEEKVLESEQSIYTLLDIMRALDAKNPETILTQAAKILSDFFKAEEFGIYHLDTSGRAMRLKVRMGSTEKLTPTIFISDSRFYSRLLAEQTVIMRQAEDEKNAPVLAGPILRGGRVREILVINRIDFSRLTPQNIQFLRLLLELISDNAEIAAFRLEENEAWLTYPDTNIYFRETFNERVRIEEEREQEFGQPYTIFDIPLQDKPNLSMTEWEARLRPYIREVDKIGYNERENKLLFLLPATTREQGMNLVSRITPVILQSREE